MVNFLFLKKNFCLSLFPWLIMVGSTFNLAEERI